MRRSFDELDLLVDRLGTCANAALHELRAIPSAISLGAFIAALVIAAEETVHLNGRIKLDQAANLLPDLRHSGFWAGHLEVIDGDGK